MRRRYIFRDGKCIEVLKTKDRRATFPGIITETIPRTFCSATGQYYDSRSALNAAMKEAGVVPVGKDFEFKAPVEQDNMPDIMDEMAKAYYDLRDGRTNDLDDEEKHICRSLDEQRRRRK